MCFDDSRTSSLARSAPRGLRKTEARLPRVDQLQALAVWYMSHGFRTW